MPTVKATQKEPNKIGVYRDPNSGQELTVISEAQADACAGNGWEYQGPAKAQPKQTAVADTAKTAGDEASKVVEDAKAEAQKLVEDAKTAVADIVKAAQEEASKIVEAAKEAVEHSKQPDASGPQPDPSKTSDNKGQGGNK